MAGKAAVTPAERRPKPRASTCCPVCPYVVGCGHAYDCPHYWCRGCDNYLGGRCRTTFSCPGSGGRPRPWWEVRK
jgi:hypothetical protein